MIGPPFQQIACETGENSQTFARQLQLDSNRSGFFCQYALRMVSSGRVVLQQAAILRKRMNIDKWFFA